MLAIVFALTALPVLASGLWLANRPRLPASRMLAVHMLLAGLALLVAAVALFLRSGDGSAIIIALAVVVNALGVSTWMRLRALRATSGDRSA